MNSSSNLASNQCLRLLYERYQAPSRPIRHPQCNLENVLSQKFDTRLNSTHALWPNCYQHHFGRSSSYLDGKAGREDQYEASPLYPAQDRLGQHEEHTCSLIRGWVLSELIENAFVTETENTYNQFHCSRPWYFPVGYHWYLCMYHFRQCHVLRIRLPRI